MFVNLVEHVTGIYLEKKEEKKIKLYNSSVLPYFPLKKMFYFMLYQIRKKSDTYHIRIIHEV